MCLCIIRTYKYICGEGYVNYIIYVKCISYIISYFNYIISISDTVFKRDMY